MKAMFNTLTDEQRVATLNSLYQKSMCTPKDKLSFSVDKLVYVKPFISQLLNTVATKDLSTRLMIRQVIDELISDIIDEIEVSCTRDSRLSFENALKDLGLNLALNTDVHSTGYSVKRVA